MNKTASMPSNQVLLKSFFEKDTKLKNLAPAVKYSKSFGYPVETKKFTDALVQKMEEVLYVEDSQLTAEQICKELQSLFNE